MTDETPQEEPPARVMLEIWFAMFWRSWLWMLPVLLAAMAVAALTGIFGAALGLDIAVINRTWSYIGYLLVAPVGLAWATIQALRSMMGLTYGGWRLTLEKLPEGY
jgi:hypothetical protein